MQNAETIKLRFIIEGEKEMPLTQFINANKAIEQFIKECYEEINEKLGDNSNKLNLKNNTPKIISVGNGCIWLQIIIELLGIAAPIFLDILKEKMKAKNNANIVKKFYFNINNNVVNVYPKSWFSKNKKKKWEVDDEALFIEIIIEKYVANKSHEDIDDFIHRLPAELQKYDHGSLKCKAQNTKLILIEL